MARRSDQDPPASRRHPHRKEPASRRALNAPQQPNATKGESDEKPAPTWKIGPARPVHVSRRSPREAPAPATALPRPPPGGPLTALVRTGPLAAHLPETLRNPLVIVVLVTDHKAYMLPEVLAALERLQWDGDKVLHVTYNGEARRSRRLVARLWRGPITSIHVELVISRDNGWHSGAVALLREETRRVLLSLTPALSQGERENGNGNGKGNDKGNGNGWEWVLWVDCDVVVPADAAEALAAHGQSMVSAVVPSREQNLVIARDVIGQGLLQPGQIKTEGLRKIAMAGFGCLLMKQEVLDDVHWTLEELPGIVDGLGGEDDHMDAEAAAAGHQLYLDPQVLCTHYGEDRRGNTLACDNFNPVLQSFQMAAPAYGGPSLQPANGRRCLWIMASLGCHGGVKVCRQMMLAMYQAGWEVSVCSLNQWEWGHWANWDFARRISVSTLEPPYDMVVANYHATLPRGAAIQGSHHVALIQSDEPKWDIEATKTVEANFRTPGYQHVIIANHMRCFDEKYGFKIVGQMDNGVDNLVFYPGWFLERKWPHSLMMILKNAPVWFTGQDYAEAAIRQLAQRYEDLEVVVVGQTAPRWPCQVRHVQTYDPNELRRLLNSVSCFVRPSLIEGFSLTDLEAMACGVPLVATPIGVSDVAVHGEDVLLVPNIETADFIARGMNEETRPALGKEITAGIVDAVTRVFEEPALREKLARNGVRLTRERTWANEQRQWMAIVDKVMAGEADTRGAGPGPDNHLVSEAMA